MSVDKLIKAGGPAFPLPDPFVMAPGNETAMRSIAAGMTLRDHFAGLALPVVAECSEVSGESFLRPENFDSAAADAYRMADAMLKARVTA